MKNPYPQVHKSNFLEHDTFIQVIPHSFSEDELQKIMAIIDSESQRGTTHADQGTMSPSEIRRSNVHFLRPPDHPWICEKLIPLVESVNQKFNFDVNRLGELQIATYDENDEGFYSWHLDIGPGDFFFRKITFSILLNNPDEYDGGDVEFMTGKKILRCPRSNAHLVAFPSFLLHQVTPVTRGKRYVMIGWFHGGDWR
jgi:PKHD-type hydroxylase